MTPPAVVSPPKAFEVALAENLQVVQTEAPPKEPDDGLISKIILIGDAPPRPLIQEIKPRRTQVPRRRRERIVPVEEHGGTCECEKCRMMSALRVAAFDSEIREGMKKLAP